MFGTIKALALAAGGLLVGGMAAPAGWSWMSQQPTSVTGCLSKGTTKDSYSITSSDGKTYSLTSTKVKLSQHVGHQVTVTGKSAAMETGAMKDTGMKMDTTMKKPTGAAGGEQLEVTSLKMVSPQCK